MNDPTSDSEIRFNDKVTYRVVVDLLVKGWLLYSVRQRVPSEYSTTSSRQFICPAVQSKWVEGILPPTHEQQNMDRPAVLSRRPSLFMIPISSLSSISSISRHPFRKATTYHSIPLYANRSTCILASEASEDRKPRQLWPSLSRVDHGIRYV